VVQYAVDYLNIYCCKSLVAVLKCALEIFGSGVFTQIRPVWVGDLETGPKNPKLEKFRPEIAKLYFLAL
jgi:hypothetical protein